MSTVTLNLEEDLVTLLHHQSDQPVQKAIKEMIVLELYRRGTISSGKAAELLGVAKIGFIRDASDLGIPYFQFTEEELEAEVDQSLKL